MRSIRERLERIATAASLTAFACTIAACSSELPAPIPRAHPENAQPRRGGTLTVATFGDIRSLDPASITDGLSPQIDQHLYAGLIDYDIEGKIVPDLAERWVVDDDGKTYRFFLREGARFHDGQEVTAEDVKRSVERALHGTAPNPYAPYLEAIKGEPAWNAQKAERLEGVEVEGRYVVTFRLDKPDAAFLPLLAMPMLRPVCASAGARYSASWHPCGAGPFKLEPSGWDHGRQLTLVRHEGYYRPGLPYLDRVRWLFHVTQFAQTFKFIQGDIDVFRDFLVPDLLRFQADPRWKPYGDYDTEKQIAGEAMNVEMPPFDNVEIRRAVAAAIDREQIRLVRATNMTVADRPAPPALLPRGVEGARGQRYDYAAALEHMRRAGYPYDPVTKTGGWPHVVPYLTYDQGLSVFTGQVVAQQLEKIGIRLELRVVNYPTFIALRGRRGASAFGAGFWQQDYPDAGTFLEPLFHSRSIAAEDANNWSFYKNPRVDDLIDRARRQPDDSARIRLYTEASNIICDEAPWAFTYHFRYYTQWQPYVRDYRTHPTWVHDARRSWIDRAFGSSPVGMGSVLAPKSLGALLGTERAR